MSVLLHIEADNAEMFLKELAKITGGLNSRTQTNLLNPSLLSPGEQQLGHTFEPEAEQPAAEEPKRRGRKPKEAAVEQDMGESVRNVEETTVDTSAASNEVTTAGTATSIAPVAAPDGGLGGVPDFDTVVAPAVLGYVRDKGKPWVVSVLNQFGAEKVTDLAPERWQELLDTLENEAG